MLTGAGLKDLEALKLQPFKVFDSSLNAVRRDLQNALRVGGAGA